MEHTPKAWHTARNLVAALAVVAALALASTSLAADASSNLSGEKGAALKSAASAPAATTPDKPATSEDASKEEPKPAFDPEALQAVFDAFEDESFRSAHALLQKSGAIEMGAEGEMASALQYLLVCMDQSVEIDGFAGEGTFEVLNNLQTAFGIEPTESLDADGYAALACRMLVMRKGADAQKLLVKGCMTQGEFDYALACVYSFQGLYFSAQQLFENSGQPGAKDRAWACAQPWPSYYGEMWHNEAFYSSDVELTFSINGFEPEVATLIKIYTLDDTLVSIMFLGGSGTVETWLPAGSYYVKTGRGSTWYGFGEAFGKKGSYKVMNFEDTGTRELLLEWGYAYTISVNTTSSEGGTGVWNESASWDEF